MCQLSDMHCKTHCIVALGTLKTFVIHQRVGTPDLFHGAEALLGSMPRRVRWVAGPWMQFAKKNSLSSAIYRYSDSTKLAKDF